jgi:DHA1 family bicyclomycin/chloramphenicol resistance-like MFS transporter
VSLRVPPPLWLLVAVTGLGPFAMQVMIPALPVIGPDLGVSSASAQLVLTLYLAGVAVGQLIYGPLADRFGRRPLMIGGMVLFLAGSLAAALAPSLGWLLLARVAQSFGGCAGMVLSRAIIRDCFPREEAASRMGYLIMGMSVMPMMAPLAGALLEEAFGWRAALFATAAMIAPLVFVVLRQLPETLPAAQPLPGMWGIAGAYLSLLRLREFRTQAAVSFCSSGVFFAFMAGAPFAVVQGMGESPRTYAIWFIVISFAFLAGSFAAGRFTVRLGMRRMLRLGLWATAVGAVLQAALVLAFPPSLLLFFLPMGLTAFGNGAAQPSAVAGAVSVKPQLAGTASGLIGAAQMGFGAVVTVLVGITEQGGGIGTSLTMAGCGLGALLALRAARPGG